MTDRRTIDNLGPEASNQYALRESQLEKAYVTDSGKVSAKPQIDVTSPGYSDEAFLTEKYKINLPWACFSKPPVKPSNVFGKELMPHLGRVEKIEGLEERVQGAKPTPSPTSKEPPMAWEGDRHAQILQKEQNIMSMCLKQLLRLVGDFETIKGAMSLYYKG